MGASDSSRSTSRIQRATIGAGRGGIPRQFPHPLGKQRFRSEHAVKVQIAAIEDQGTLGFERLTASDHRTVGQRNLQIGERRQARFADVVGQVAADNAPPPSKTIPESR